MFRKVLIANRGAIACRITRTLKRMGIAAVAVYSEPDRETRHVLDADERVLVGAAPAAQSYLNVERILAAAEETGAEAIHPGYGFLSENVEFARECARRGIAFIGPRVEQIEAFALKHTAREIAQRCGVPLLPGTGLLSGGDEALKRAQELGYPVMLKSSAGGGGIGMRVCRTAAELSDAYDSVVRLSRNSFRDGSVYLEKFVGRAKHVEAQIFGNGKGGIAVLGLRDCSAQRRHQKVIEETPVPGLRHEVAERMRASAELLGKAVNYASAGTVEFLYDADTEAYFFLEVNTRLQVEHGVTEQVTGLDLVEMMVREAAGELPPLEEFRVQPRGCSIQVRVYAEDPAKNFQPAPGKAGAGEISGCGPGACGDLGGERDGGYAVLRSHDCQDYRDRNGSRGCGEAVAACAGSDGDLRDGNESALPAGSRSLRNIHERRNDHGLSGFVCRGAQGV
jgi:urea carboxylase